MSSADWAEREVMETVQTPIYLTVKQVSVRIIKSTWWVYMALEKGMMPGKKIGGSWRIPIVDLIAWEQGRL
jgi:hypothetical protein